MLGRILLPQYNYCIVNFNRVYRESFVPELIDSLNTYKINDIRIKNKDFKKLFTHSLIHSLCEEIINSKTLEKTVIYFNTTTLPHTELNKTINDEELINFIEKIILKIRKLLPIKIFITSNTFDYFAQLVHKNDAKAIEIVNNIRSLCEKIKLEKYTFQKIRSYSKRFGLTFLSDVYFNNIKSKQLLIK